MNITENRPIPNEPRADATDPTTDVIEEMSNASLSQFMTASCILKSLPREGTLSMSQMFSLSIQRAISDVLNEAVWRFADTLWMMLETTGMTCVMMPTNNPRTSSRVMMARSQSGARCPFILILRSSFMIGLPRRETTAARIM